MDLNCDLGESFGPWPMGRDAAVMPLVTSANIACGFHAGDPATLAQSIDLCLQHGVAIGAHPGYRDLHGFGRRAMVCSEDEVYGDVLYQIGALYAFVRARGASLHHVKPHGALSGQAAVDPAVARGIARAVAAFDPGVLLYVLPGSALHLAAVAAGLRVVREGFADRAYNPDGTLVDRSQPGAVIHDPRAAADRAVRMARDGKVRARDGSEIDLPVETICVHGDNPAAVALIQAIRQGLTAAGITLAPAPSRR